MTVGNPINGELNGLGIQSLIVTGGGQIIIGRVLSELLMTICWQNWHVSNGLDTSTHTV